MSKPKTLVVGIAGGTGSGKSTVARSIIEYFGESKVTILLHDAYYKNFNHLPKIQRDKLNFDHPDALNNELFAEHLTALKDGQQVQMPIYDFTTHSPLPETKLVTPRSIIVVDGILIFAIEPIRKLLDLKVFVDTEADIRILRRIQRDIQERGRTLESVADQYINTVKPMHDMFVESSKKFADIILPEGGHNQTGLQALIGGIEKLKTSLDSNIERQ